MTISREIWEVVGGSQTCGIVVRSERDRSSAENELRLLSGALVRGVEHDKAAGRLHYELLVGTGPRSGWVTTKTQGKELLRPWQAPVDAVSAPQQTAMPAKEILERSAAPFFRKEALTVGRAVKQFDKGVSNVGGLGVVAYSGQKKVGSLKLNSRIVPKAACDEPSVSYSVKNEDWFLCPECQLPIGEFAYCREGDTGPFLHGECQAQVLLQHAKREEKSRKRRDAELKKKRRAEYDIGWKIERVPRSTHRSYKMGLDQSPHGMYSLMFSEKSNTVRILPTTNPETAMNLEYLALALQVRRREGREPMFSLDIQNALDRSRLWQLKRFEPAWLAGTSMGEVMFQADFHLKELSMGEYVQPVVGMRSCFDFVEAQTSELDWNAREWFVVRRAEVQLSEEDALIPRVSMGVEAREQIASSNGLEDALLTSPDHPLVKYANEFEHNFDLIAERKSVVYQLRELAKASVLAKFLVDNKVSIDDGWFHVEEAVQDCIMEIPQLWNERFYSEIQVKDGRIMDAETGIGTKKCGLYGGVELGLERVMAPGVVRPRAPALTMARGQLSRSTAASGLLGAGREGFEYAPLPGVGAPRGVDLNLDTFNLSEAKRTQPGASTVLAFGTAFFRSLDSSAAGFSREDADLFKSVFNPVLSDRRGDGDLFMPPDSSAEYMVSLRRLVAEEKAASERRKDHFLSEEFQRETPGPLFPSSWTPSHGINSGRVARPVGRELHARPGYHARMERTVKSMTPVFDQATEDGTKFRIYEVGSLEVRTVQDYDDKETLGVIFSGRVPTVSSMGKRPCDDEDDVIVSAMQFVEASQQIKFHLYVVFETTRGDLIMTEMLSNQRTAWIRNPEDLEARNSCAKALRRVDCSRLGITIRDVRGSKEADAGHSSPSNLQVQCARYSDNIYSLVQPAWERKWAALWEREKEAVHQLGLTPLWGQERGSGEVGSLGWGDLTEQQREVAVTLGLDEATWGKSVCWVPKEKRWTQLTGKEQQAARDLGIPNAESWDGVSRQRLRLERKGVWDKTWAQLCEPERQAARVLGVLGAGMWDTGCWTLGGAWRRSWKELTEAEREAANKLGAAGEEAWDKRSARVWRKGWQDLSANEHAAACLIGFDRDCWASFI